MTNRPQSSTRNISEQWEKNFLLCELILSIALVGITYALVAFFSWGDLLHEKLKNNRGQAYGSLAGVFATAFGSAVTTAAVVIGFLAGSNPKFEKLRKRKAYCQLWDAYWSSFRWLGVGTVATILALFMDRDESPTWGLFYFVALCVVVSIFRVGRCLWILRRIVELAIPFDRPENPD